MSERWFYTRKELVDETRGILALPEDEAYHAVKVLRLKEGEQVTVIDGQKVYSGEIVKAKKDEVIVQIINEEVVLKKEPELILCQAFPKGKKADFIVEKTTELGVDKIIFFPSEYSVAKFESAKIDRFSKLALQASKQSKRPYPPEIEMKNSLFLPEVSKEEIVFVFDLEGEVVSFKSLENLKPKKIYLFVGPEGGFSSKERESFLQKGYRLIKLNLPVLRAETAALASIFFATLFFRKL